MVPYNWRAGSVTVPANALSLHRQLDGYFGYDDVGVIASTATGRLANIRHAGLATGFLCFRTPAVRDAIVAAISGVSHCADVSYAHLARIQSLKIRSTTLQTSGLRAGDFAGLSGLTELDIGSNGLTALPAGIFDSLTSLTYLNLWFNDLTSLPAGIFDKTTALRRINLKGNGLTALPSGIFDKTTALRRRRRSQCRCWTM